MNAKTEPAKPGPAKPGRGGAEGRLVPDSVRVAAMLSGCFLLIAAAVWVLVWMVGYLAAVTVPVGVAFLADSDVMAH